MIIRSQAVLCTFAILLALAVGGCKQQPAATQSPASSPIQPTIEGTATPASAANAPAKGKIDPCTLLSAKEIQSVQGDALKETKESEQSSGPFTTSQCFYTTANFANSISLTVTQKNLANPGGQSVREFWKERFGRTEGHEKDRGKRREKESEGGEEEKESLPPQRVKSLGDEAYSVGDAKVGALYVLKGDRFLRISVGGAQSQQARIEKMKTLAQYVISRL